MLINKEDLYLHNNCYYRQYKNGTGVLYPAAVIRKRTPDETISENLKKSKKRLREYKIDRKKVQSASIDLFQKKTGKCILFLTFTFPGKPTEKDAAKVWEQVLHSLRETYNVTLYVWVKEFQKRGVIHYHLLVDKTFIPIKKLQTTFNRICYHNGLKFSNGSVSLGENPRVFDISRIKFYLSKYIAKGADDESRVFIFTGRCFGFSELLELFKTFTFSDLLLILEKYKPVKVIHDHFYSIYYFNECFP